MSIRRDAHGIPHAWGTDLLELAREQGRATAQDRRWQLEIDRLRGEGRTAELVGAGGVGWDTLARRARIAETAQEAHAAAAPETRDFLEAYVEGVRSALPTAPSVELDVLGDAPGEWQPWTPMATWLVHHVLFGAFGHHVWRRRLRRELPGAAALFGTGTGDPWTGGSNAFVIGGGLTESGFPIVAGDPHRLFEVPNVYMQVGLACPGTDVVGLTIPGVPGVQHFGHAGDVAWAVTNAMADQQQLVEVALDDCVETVEAITVRGEEPVSVSRWESPAGPGLLLDGDVVACIALPSYASLLDALVPLLRARSVDDVDLALDRWVEPVNNVLVADRSGRTLHRVAGRMPVPLPRVAGRRNGVLVSANDRATDDFDVLGSRFAASYRADRIRALLAGSQSWTVDDVARVLGDVRLDHDGLLRRVAGLPDEALTGRARVTRDRLLGWDRRLVAASGDAAAYGRVRDRLVGLLADHAALRPLADADVHGELWVPWLWVPGRIASSLAAWLAADRPLGIDVDGLVARALDVEERDETWGERHRFRPVHALSDLGLDRGLVHELEHRLEPPVSGHPLSGDSDCVAATGSLPGLPDVVMGPVARYVWDLGDRAASRWAVPLGAAGDPRDPHHCDQFEPWSLSSLLPLDPPLPSVQEQP